MLSVGLLEYLCYANPTLDLVIQTGLQGIKWSLCHCLEEVGRSRIPKQNLITCYSYTPVVLLSLKVNFSCLSAKLMFTISLHHQSEWVTKYFLLRRYFSAVNRLNLSASYVELNKLIIWDGRNQIPPRTWHSGIKLLHFSAKISIGWGRKHMTKKKHVCVLRIFVLVAQIRCQIDFTSHYCKLFWYYWNLTEKRTHKLQDLHLLNRISSALSIISKPSFFILFLTSSPAIIEKRVTLQAGCIFYRGKYSPLISYSWEILKRKGVPRVKTVRLCKIVHILERKKLKNIINW